MPTPQLRTPRGFTSPCACFLCAVILAASSSTGCSPSAPPPAKTEHRAAVLRGTVVDPRSDTVKRQMLAEYRQTAAQNARLIAELRQRGIDVHDSERGVVVNLPDVLFQSGKAALTHTAREIVAEISQVMQRAPSRRLLVEGHTDSVSTIEYNYRLSGARAQEVANALEANGIAKDTISIRALGETTPIATNRTAEGRRRNRRVEVIIENEKE